MQLIDLLPLIIAVAISHLGMAHPHVGLGEDEETDYPQPWEEMRRRMDIGDPWMMGDESYGMPIWENIRFLCKRKITDMEDPQMDENEEDETPGVIQACQDWLRFDRRRYVPSIRLLQAIFSDPDLVDELEQMA